MVDTIFDIFQVHDNEYTALRCGSLIYLPFLNFTHPVYSTAINSTMFHCERYLFPFKFWFSFAERKIILANFSLETINFYSCC